MPEQISSFGSMEKRSVHDHLCLIYENQKDQFDAVIPFIRIGLAKGEKCIYVADDNTADQVLCAMRAYGIDVESALRKGAVVIATKKQTYLKQDYFDPDEMIQFLKESVDSAKNMGFPALRVTGEMTWILGKDPGTMRLLEFESKLNLFLQGNDCLAICQYNKNRFSPEILTGIINTHPLVIAGGFVCKNFYYIPYEEFLKKEKKSLEIERLLYKLIDREKAEEAMRESEEKFKSIFNNAMDGILVVDIETQKYKLGNRMICKMLGFDENELKNMSAKDIIPENDLPYVMEQFEKQVRGEIKLAKDIPLKRKDGSILYVDTNASFIMIGGKKYILGIFRDITERKQAEERLRSAALYTRNLKEASFDPFAAIHDISHSKRAEIEYKTLINTAMDGFYVVDTQGRILDANNSYCSLIGYDRDELLNMNLKDVEAIESEEIIAQHMQRIMKAGCDRFETRHKCKDGRLVVLETSVNYMGVESGKFFVFMRDITQRMQMEKALRENEKKYRDLFENAMDAMFTVDVELNFLDVNKIGIEMLGYTKEEIIGSNISRWVTPESLGIIHERQKKRLSGEKVNPTDILEIVGKNGEHKWIEIRTRVIRSDDGRIEIHGIARDITENRFLTQELKKSSKQQKLLCYLIQGTRGGKTRSLILKHLSDRSYNANELATALNMDYKTIRHHLDVLIKNGIVGKRKLGYPNFYFVLDNINLNLYG